MKKLPLTPLSFKDIITNEYIYVDKTEHIYKLITQYKYVLFARPDFFGKSLLLSTLHELFQGNKHLFNTLFISTTHYTWETYPVIYLDFNTTADVSPQEFQRDLVYTLETIAGHYTINITPATTLEDKLALLVKQLARTKPVVVLIDNYDFPLVAHSTSGQQDSTYYQELLNTVFTTLQNLDAYLHFVLFTGISSSTAQALPGLQHVRDITYSSETATLLGYTREELTTYFRDYLDYAAQEKKISSDELLTLITDYYNGYHFSHENSTVYNPTSVMHFLNNTLLQSYFFADTLPYFMLHILAQTAYPIYHLDGALAHPEELTITNFNAISYKAALVFTGYLTLKSYQDTDNTYTLGFPNRETVYSFFLHTLSALSKLTIAHSTELLARLIFYLEQHTNKAIIDTLTLFFNALTFIPEQERTSYYEAILYSLTSLMPFHLPSGYIRGSSLRELYIETSTHIYVFGFKCGSASHILEALEQHGEFKRYIRSSKPVLLIGICFTYEPNLTIQWASLPFLVAAP